MRCPNCKSNVDDRWQFCPKCGTRLRRRRSLFDQLFSHFGREFEQMDKEIDRMEKRFEALDLSPFFRQTGGKGFKIKVVRHGGDEPKVSVQTFGDVKGEDIRKELKKQMGREGQPIKIRIGPPRPRITRSGPAPGSQGPEAKPRKELPTPKTTEEPKTEVRRVDSKVMVDMELPGVKSLEDIRINEMQESVEVRAVAGERGFFKILTKPGQFRLSGKSFKAGKLHLEFS